MSDFVPKFKLYDYSGLVLEYTFPLVQVTNAPQSHKRSVVIEGVRGKGCLIIDAGEDSWDLTIEGKLMIDGATEGYEELTAKIDDLESKVQLHTPYILRIDKTESTYYEYHVTRIEPIEYPESFRTDIQDYSVTFRVNSW